MTSCIKEIAHLPLNPFHLPAPLLGFGVVLILYEICYILVFHIWWKCFDFPIFLSKQNYFISYL